MIKWSIILGVLGVAATAGVVPHLNSWVSSSGPRKYWLLGLTALFPAWLIAFLALIPAPTAQGPRASLPPSVIFSSGLALLGVIFTDMAVRRLEQSGYSFSPFVYWRFGVVGLVPAWIIALWVLLWFRSWH